AGSRPVRSTLAARAQRDRLRTVPEPLPADPVPPRHLAGHLPGVGRRGRPGTPAVPAVRVRRRPPRRRRPPPMAADQPALVKGGPSRLGAGADEPAPVEGRTTPRP